MSQMHVASYRGNCQRTGEYLDAGVPDLHGVAWRFQTQGTVESTPVVAGGIVLFGSTDGFFYALDGETGDLRWRYQTRGKVTTPADVANGVVYFGDFVGNDDDDNDGDDDDGDDVDDGTGTLYALDLHTGKEFWIWDETCLPSFEEMLKLVPSSLENWIYFDEILDDRSLGAILYPTVSDGKLYFFTDKYFILALDLTTRKLVWWQARSDEDALKILCPVLANGILYSTFCSSGQISFGETLIPFRTDTGNAAWFSDPDDVSEYEDDEHNWIEEPDSLAVRDNILYVVNFEGITGVDIVTGKRVWRGEREYLWLGDGNYFYDPKETALAAGPERVYETIAGWDKTVPMTVSVYDRQSGKVIWRQPPELDTREFSDTPGKCLPPSLAGSVLYVIQGEDTCCALDAATGQERWRLQLEKSIVAPPCIANETVFVAAGRSVYALR